MTKLTTLRIPSALAPVMLLNLVSDLSGTSPLACRLPNIPSWTEIDTDIPVELIDAIRSGDVRSDAMWGEGSELWLCDLLNAALAEM
jgi:hypothetical protein